MGEIELGPAAEATIQAYKELALDPAKRLALALDRTCIQFLAYVVAEGEGSLVQAAIDTLTLIAEAKDCRPSLANTFGVLEALQSVTEDEESYSQNLRDQAGGLFTSLQFARHIKNPTKETKTDNGDSRSSLSSEPSSVSTASTYTPTSSLDQINVKQSDNVDGSGDIKSGTEPVVATTQPVKKDGGCTNKSAVEKRESFLGPHNSRAKIVTLFIKGMVNPAHRKLVEEELVRVRGLISIVFDLGHSRVTCRVKRDLPPEKLAAAVARTETFTALQVTTNDKGEEEMISLDPASRPSLPSTHKSEEEELPDYLPEEDLEPIEDATSAMAPSGTLMETATTWFSSATNLLQKSFYW
ncbi:hypothetical protein Pcinc_034631 [Petrolisthes cinctipes]|uniref:Armadillo repeat-containing protein 1 n=1 Tax=Petrolisthes cinctipes TaxID=88211 RepID=A0AAE1EQ11_PETCI|nr:hypothetical protein Pcinc_034631 [Petrolisthes cinctipes]